MPFDSTIGMYDFGFLPPNFSGDVQVFFSDNNAQGSQKWIKRRGMTMCYMICIGGGGGGGGGLTGATTTARGGGGGGACSSIAKMLIPAIFLPDVLLVQVGNGGAGKGSGTAGNAGVNSIISYGAGVTAIGTIPNIILQSNNAAPGGGAAGTGAGNAAGGTVPTISTQAISGAAASHGIQSFIVGLVGATGGVATGGAGTALGAQWVLLCLTPGTGGGGVNTVSTGFAGGNISLTSAFDFADGSLQQSNIILGGVAGASGTGPSGNGNAGIQLWKPFYMTGSTGGGSSDANTGGNGGNGGIGCGGGGGGAGTTGGTGGNGGNGIVVIISW